MSRLHGRRVLVGISGGIAAYKSVELVRLLKRAGADVRVVMTASATEFVTPLTLQAISGTPVRCALFDREAEAAMGHIELARWADLILIAPASANLMARLAHGLADDLLTTLCLASEAPVLLAPAMNRVMWNQAATRANADTLRARGVRLLGPAIGEQACGETGPGRMQEPAELLAALEQVEGGGALEGVRVLINAGPTREAIDPVRFLSNRSSGKMGYAIADAAVAAGASVTLISGPVALDCPPHVRRVWAESAQEMHDAVMASVADADIFIAAAAVADYRPYRVIDRKMKKDSADLTLRLAPTTDIIAAVAALPAGPFTVGFAAETHDVHAYARAKLRAKGLDMIAANRVGEGQGFEVDDNALDLFWDGGGRQLVRAPKPELARALIATLAERYRLQDSNREQGPKTHANDSTQDSR